MNRDVESALRSVDPARDLDRVAVDEAQQALLDEILEQGRPRRNWSSRTGARWVPVVAAAAVGALVIGTGVVLGSSGDDDAAPAAGAPGDPQRDHPRGEQTTSGDPGLPPTGDNLVHVIVNTPGWEVDGLSQSPYGSDLSFVNGDQMLGLVTYPADQYDSYIRDRAIEGPESSTEALGQVGRSFTYEMTDPTGDEPGSEEQLIPRDGPEPGSGGVADPDQVDTRIATIFPVVGDWFLEVDATVGSETEFRALMSSLERVDTETWQESLGADVVTPNNGQAFLDEASEDVPMPPGFTVTVDQLNLPQQRYQAAATFVAAVSCEWFAQYEAGNSDAVPALQSSRDWPVLAWMDVEGDYPEVLWEYADRLDTGDIEGYSEGLGCLA